MKINASFATCLLSLALACAACGNNITIVPRYAPAGTILHSSGLPSADGRYLALTGDVLNDDPERPNGWGQVFRLDRQTGETKLVSRSQAGEPGNNNSFGAAISPDGRRILFRSSASNLVAGDTNNWTDVYLADVDAGTLTLVSARDGGEMGSQTAVSSSWSPPVMSSDGRWVAFDSEATDLTAGFEGSGRNVFLRDTVERKTWCISPNGKVDNPGSANGPRISDDGSRVTFVYASATNPASYGLYLYERPTSTLVPLAPGATVLTNNLATSGNVVAYVERRVNPGRHVLWHQRLGGSNQPAVEVTTLTLSSPPPFPLLSADGMRLAFQSSTTLPSSQTGLADTNDTADIFHYDATTERLRIVSVEPNGQLGYGGAFPSLSRDGLRVTFSGTAPARFIGLGGYHRSDVYVHDLVTGQTTFLTASSTNGPYANGESGSPKISADGRTVFFSSSASDLVNDDTNGVPDLFAVALPIQVNLDADGNGLPDAWEQAHFGATGQNATEDADGDGQTNRQEFDTGSDPKQANSPLTVQATQDSTGGLTVRWPGVRDVVYVVETFNPGQTDGFQRLGTSMVGTGQELTFSLPEGDGALLFRVRAQR